MNSRMTISYDIGGYGPVTLTDGAADERVMREAIDQAQLARDRDEVPVGAVVVLKGAIIGRGFNQPISGTGAVVHARIGRLLYGAPEPKAGAVRSAMQVLDDPALNHRVEVVTGVLEEECRELMQAFFTERRA
jgi:tRNA(adenine34) deaminase